MHRIRPSDSQGSPSDPTGQVSVARGLIAPAATAAAALAGAALIAWRNPATAGFYPPCPSKVLTGLDCPGCGGLRGTHALLHGDVITAMDHNLLLLPIALLAVWMWIAWTAETAGRRVPTLPSTPAISALLFGIVAVFTVARNIPGMPFLPA